MGNVIHWKLCKKFKLDHTNKGYVHNLEKEMHKLLWGFEIQTDHLITARRTDLVIIYKKMRTCRIVNFAVPVDPRVIIKESEKRNKYLDPVRDLKLLWNMKVTVIPIVISTLGTISEGLVRKLVELEIKGWPETIQTTALLSSARMQRVLETWGKLLSLRQRKTISLRSWEKFAMSKIIITSIHDRLAQQLSTYNSQWMTKGKTILLQIDPTKGIIMSKYRPITSLPIMWLIQTVHVRTNLYSLESCGRFLEKGKWCCKGTWETNDLL